MRGTGYTLVVILSGIMSLFSADTHAAICGWQWLNPVPYWSPLGEIWVVADNHIYLGGGDGVIIHYDGSSWSYMASGGPNHISDFWGFSPNDIWAVTHETNPASDTTIFHFDGTSWSLESVGNLFYFYGVWGTSSTDLFCVGHNPSGLDVTHYDGTTWTVTDIPDATLGDVWGTSSSDVYAVGDYLDPILASQFSAVYRYDGASWTLFAVDYGSSFYNKIWGFSSNDMYCLGLHSGDTSMMHYDGITWAFIADLPSFRANDMWGITADNLFIAGQHGIYRYDGYSISLMSGTETHTYGGIHGNSVSDVFTVGYNADTDGLFMQYDGITWSTIIKTVSQTENELFDIWACSTNDVFIAADENNVIHFDGRVFSYMTPPTRDGIMTSVWGFSPTDVYAGGRTTGINKGHINHYDGSSWTTVFLTDFFIYDIWGSETTNVYAVSTKPGHLIGGRIVHYDGSTWSIMVDNASCDFTRICGVSPTNIFAVGDGDLYYYNGSTWSAVPVLQPPEPLNSIWGPSSTELWGVCESRIYHYHGSSWTLELTVHGGHDLFEVWGTSLTDIYVVGNNYITDMAPALKGTIVHYDGTRWSVLDTPVFQTMHGIFGSSPENVYTVGYNGNVLNYRCISPTIHDTTQKSLFIVCISFLLVILAHVKRSLHVSN